MSTYEKTHIYQRMNFFFFFKQKVVILVVIMMVVVMEIVDINKSIAHYTAPYLWCVMNGKNIIYLSLGMI